MTTHPPNPRLTLRVGLTGHRPDKLPWGSVERIKRQLPAVFAAIGAAARDIVKDNENFYAKASPVIRLITGFAEGTDQIAVAACPADWRIEAILPFPFNEYLMDFAEPAARDAFLESIKRAAVVTQLVFPPSGNRDKAYAEAGSFLLRQIDLLVVVWDGAPPKTGGTGALARKAFEGGIPVVWLSTVDSTQPSSDDGPVPRLISGFKDDTPIATEADCTKGPLLTALLPIFAAPPASAGSPGRRSARVGLEKFFRERWHLFSFAFVHDFLKRVVRGRMPRLDIPLRPLQRRLQDWDKFLDQAPETRDLKVADQRPGDLRTNLRTILLERFAWADTLAEHYGHRYRSAYILAYLLSAVAVFAAVGHHVFEEQVYVGIELFAIIAILGIILVGRHWHWHERWMDYRALAENLRHGRFLAFVGEFGRIHDTAPRPSGREPPWMLWYIRATMREIGLPTATLDATYQWRLLEATLANEIQGSEGQLAYHQDNQKTVGRIDHMLHFLGNGCFYLTFFILVLLAAAAALSAGKTQLESGGAPVSSFFAAFVAFLRKHQIFWTAGLPALGAALSGIRAHGDFEGLRERSAHMVDELNLLQRRYKTAVQHEMNFTETYDVLMATARVLSEDVAAWQELYGRKPLNLPA
ncbi:MAG: DUF4231 domain-containing protein [Xanthobacteraceae bacterium]